MKKFIFFIQVIYTSIKRKYNFNTVKYLNIIKMYINVCKNIEKLYLVY